MIKDSVVKGDRVCLVDEKYHKYIIDTAGDFDKYRGVGVFDPSSIVGTSYGKLISIGNKTFWVLQPDRGDGLQALKRNAQIILPRDTAQIISGCSIQSGSRVLESGIGSGSLTLALASIVAPDGEVISYDIREDFIRHARGNLRQMGCEHLVRAELHDVTEGIGEKDLDAVVLDMPTPWKAIGHAWEALRPGGWFCGYSPLISQVEETVKALRDLPFIEIRSIENIQRELVVAEQGTRPSFDMLGHTGYLTFARKIMEKR